MSRSRARKKELPVETSWRMVEGEGDSFDTSLVAEDLLDQDISFSGPSQLSNLSQLSQLSQLSSKSQGDWNIGGSQDHSTIQDFISRADDERVIMRSPFQPSVPGAVRKSSRGRDDEQPPDSPEPEFHMPRVDVDSPRRVSSAASSRTLRQGDAASLRQRQNGGSAKRKQAAPDFLFANAEHEPPQPPPSVSQRLATSLPHALYDILAWAFGVVGTAFSYAQKPLAVALAIYFVFGSLILVQNLVKNSVYSALSPICNLPGMNYIVDLPFCATSPGPTGGAGNARTNIEFDGLVGIQEQFENVLEKSADGISLPMEMKRTESSIRDLRTMVRYSQLPGRDELVLDFDMFIETIREGSGDLQKFNSHVGAAVDSVISINRWTSRYLDGLIAAEKESKGLLGDLVAWVFAPFQPAVFSEQNLVDKYIEHTALISEKISSLITEAQAVLMVLQRAESHLDEIYAFVTRTQNEVEGRKTDVFWTIWTIVGGNYRKIHNLNNQLDLLRQVHAQRDVAVRQVTELLGDLERIQHDLETLREAVASPRNADAVSDGKRGHGSSSLSSHIDTINRGVERLEHARSRIRGIENDRIREVLARGKGEDRLIDSS